MCLVYNLIQQRVSPSGRKSVQAPDYSSHITTAASLLEKELTGPGKTAKIAWLLEHQYSPDGLAFAALKSSDKARAEVLTAAAARAGCAVHLGLVHIEESGAAEPHYGGYRSRRWGRHDSDDSEYALGDNFEVIEVCDWRHFVSQWRDVQDRPVGFGELPIAPGELLPAGALDGEKPDQQRLMEASGNEGATFERSYHRAAVVIWRRERYAEVLLQSGVAAVIPYLEQRIACAQEPKASAELKQEVLALARLLINTWKAIPEVGGIGRPARPDRRDEMLRLLVALGNPALLEEFVAEVVVREYDGSDNAALVAAARLLGPSTVAQLFPRLVRQHQPLLQGDGMDLLQALTAARERTAPGDWRAASLQVAEAVVDGLDTMGSAADRPPWQTWHIQEKARVVNASLIADLFNVLEKLDSPALRLTAADKLAARPAVFDPVVLVTPALGAIRQQDDAFFRLWKHAVEFLLHRSSRPPTAPTDWRQEVTLSCSCEHCQELKRFALDPVEQTHRFRARQDLRMHVEQTILRHQLAMKCVTERKGSPQTLVCTKDRRDYLHRCEQYDKDIAALTQLGELTDDSPRANAEPLRKIAAARERAKNWKSA